PLAGQGFALYSLSLASTTSETVTFTGTTVNGKPVTQSFDVAANTGFNIFDFPSTFTALASVSWTPGAALVDNIVATAFLPNQAATNPLALAGTSGAASQAITFDTTNLTIAINGVTQTGMFNGTPFTASVVNGLAQFRFQGDLFIPNNSTVTASG